MCREDVGAPYKCCEKSVMFLYIFGVSVGFVCVLLLLEFKIPIYEIQLQNIASVCVYNLYLINHFF